MKPQHTIITGANRGLGFQTAATLAARGHTVILACRKIDAALNARDTIRTQTGNPEVHALELDLCSQSSILKFVQDYRDRFGHVNVLINNAGIVTQFPEITPEGFDRMFMTNFLGPYLLTRHLLPLFESGSDDRIIQLTSGIYPFGSYRLEKLGRYHWVKGYAVTKYLMLQSTLGLAEELNPAGIRVKAVDPGVVRTSIMFTRKWYDVLIHAILLPFYVSVEKGSDSIVFLADAPEVSDATGQCFYKRRIKRVGKKIRDPKRISRLFTYIDQFINQDWKDDE